MRAGVTVRHDRSARTTRESRMPSTPDSAPQSAPNAHEGGRARRALARSWREAVIPLGAGDTAAIPSLRALCRRILEGWKIPTRLIDDVELAVSELATNALRYTRGPVRVRLTHRGGTLLLDVADTSTRHPEPAARGIDENADHGRGLGIVAALADRVRTEPYPGNPQAGKHVSAEFDLAE
jgi:anti-sigma regulatory factor (Ser/Thr protein kinase)